MLLALQIFNLSVSVIDFQPIYASASLYEEFNDLDTVIEYISEILLDYKNSFPEPEKPASNTQASFEKHVSLKKRKALLHMQIMLQMYMVIFSLRKSIHPLLNADSSILSTLFIQLKLQINYNPEL